MNPEGATPISLGFGAERHIAKSRSASEPNEKVEHLTCAVEALLLHVISLEGEARAARDVAAPQQGGMQVADLNAENDG
jgi:hypothetical protein